MEFNLHDSLLGKENFYPENYNPSLLFRIPRAENRVHYGIDAAQLPFMGIDVWNCYEFSFLCQNGLPVSGMLKIIYPAESQYLVESKSLKLYLNSFNMERISHFGNEAILNGCDLISNDLSNLLEVKVKVVYFDNSAETLEPFEGLNLKNLTEIVGDKQLRETDFSDFNENPALLEGCKTGELQKYAFRTDLLRSNCRVTNQPDWGDLFLYMETPYKIDLLSVIKYLVSFRKENHFHEEVVEMIYKRFYDMFEPKKLLVAAMYTRRGGIDINPLRASHSDLIDPAFSSDTYLLAKTLRQ